MSRYIALLKGVNVSGQRKIRMADLAVLFENLECRHVQTYIQSGNVVFNLDEAGNTDIAGLVEKEIANRYGFSVSVFIRTRDEFNTIAMSNPFSAKNSDLTKLHVTFLSMPPGNPAEETALAAYTGPDEFFLAGKEVYLHCPGGYGRTRLSNTYLEKVLSTTATTRNWKTVLTLTEMAGKSNG